MERMRTKQSFIAFNLLWCIGWFLIPNLMIPIAFPTIKGIVIVVISLAIYVYGILKQSYQDWLEWRISELEEKFQ